MLGMSQPPGHDAAHGHVDQDLAGRAQALVILGDSTALTNPREGALHDPPPGQHAAEAGPLWRQSHPLEPEVGEVAQVPDGHPVASRLRRMLYDLHAPAELLLDPRFAAASVALVHPQVLEP